VLADETALKGLYISDGHIAHRRKKICEQPWKERNIKNKIVSIFRKAGLEKTQLAT